MSTSRHRVLSAPLFAFALLPLMSTAAHAVPVLPVGGKVVAGSASIGKPGSGGLTVKQAGGKAIIDWSGFSIGKGGEVVFDNGSGATLNRVTGGAVSSLDGLLTATGSVYVINPNGVIVGRSGVVRTGGSFVASALDTSNAGFLAGGDLSFGGTSSAAVVNYGRIGSLGGDVVLVAARVSNAGAITASKGDAGLLAGYSVTLTDASLNDGRFAVNLGGANTSAANPGLIQAADAELRAEGGSIYALAGNTAGTIRATGVESGGGKVWLVAEGGALKLAGSISAKGAGKAAGAVETSGGQVSVGKASIDAHGGTWLVDPYDLTIDSNAATTIDNALNANTSVVEQTTATGSSGAGTVNTSGSGDIILAAPLSWSTAASLTLSAYRNVTLNANQTIASTGGGAVTLYADNTGTGTGTVGFGSGAGVSTSGAVNIFYNPAGDNNTTVNSTSYKSPTDFTGDVSGGATLTPYMLVNTVYDLQNVQNNLSGDYALGKSIDASTTASWNSGAGLAPIGAGSNFTGVFNGQGDTISNLTINRPGTSTVGLFGSIGSPAVIENLGLVGGAVSGGAYVGALVGVNSGSIVSDYASVNVTGSNQIGGLVGGVFGTVTLSSASGTVSGNQNVGGLAGYVTATLTSDHASGAVSGNQYVGGLVGQTYNPISSSYATGTVTGTSVGGDPQYIGGLAGSAGGAVTLSYATGSVSTPGNGSFLVGGLVGQSGAAVTQSYATGAVVGSTNGQDFGGLVGGAFGPVSEDYATGAVSGGFGATSVGGLVGQTNNGSSITQSWSSGAVSTTRQYSGGLVGYNSGVSISSSYWDTITSGRTTSAGGTGLTTSQFFTASNLSGLTFGTTGGADGWVIVDGDGSLNNASGAAGATRPILLSEYATTLVNAHQLELANLNVAANYTLASNIDASATNGAVNPAGVWGATGFVPIGADANVYTGTFNGQGYAIGGLYIYRTSARATGLFGAVNNTADTAIENVSLTGVSITGGNGVYAETGGLVGLDYGAAISNSSVAGSVSGDDYVGGMVGKMEGGSVSQSYAAATVTGADFDVGGLVGVQSAGSISQSHATGRVTGGTADVGGLVGLEEGSIAGSYATGAVIGTVGGDLLGGLVGEDSGGTISQSYATGAVSGAGGSGSQGGEIGGLVGGLDIGGAGNTYGSIQQSYATGAVTGATGNGALGGLVGASQGAISQSYALGAVTGASSSAIAGLVGYNTGTITQSYSTGLVTAPNSTDVGGFVGYNNGGSVANSYWDTTTSGQSTAGIGSDATNAGVTGLSTSQFQTASNLSGLTFGTTGGASGFVIVDGDGTLNNAAGAAGSTRPLLLAEYSTGIVNAHQLQLMALNLSTNYTLIGNIDASATTGANAAGIWSTAGFVPIGTDAGGSAALRYAGVFNGQGFVISGLTINRPGVSYDGLFGYVTGATTVLENVGLVGGSFAGGDEVAPLVGQTALNAFVINAYATGSATGTNGYVGGLVGRAGGPIIGSHATGAVSGVQFVGGLVGGNASVSQSYATGSVSGASYVGGLSGFSSGTVSQSYATGAVTGTGTTSANGYLGGLLGYNVSALTSDYATGSVTGGASNQYIGGLVGDEQGGSITLSHASGAVTGGASAQGVGGLVGSSALSNTATTTQDYATGAVTAGAGSTNVGGLEGFDAVATNQSYATGQVTGGSSLGGLIGSVTAGASATNSYWDTGTTGQGASAGGGTGESTTALQSGLPGGFNNSVWSIVAGESYPYLGYQFSGAPQVVSGVASSGGSGLAGATVKAFAGGVQLASSLTGGAASTGANGYYYYLLAPGTVAAGTSDQTGVTLTAAGGAMPVGLTYANTSLADGSVSGLNLTSGLVYATTGESSFSAFNSDVGATFGVSNYAALSLALASADLQLQANGAFTVDQAVSRAGSLILTAGGGLTVSSALTSTAGGVSLTNTTGNLGLGAGVSAATGAVLLNSAGLINQTGGTITASSLAVSAAAADLEKINAIATLSSVDASTGDFSLTDGRALTVNGPVTVEAGDLSLATTSGALTLAGAVSDAEGTLTLRAGGAIIQSGGTITAVTLTGSAGGAVNLGRNGNAFAKLGAFNVTTGDLNLTDGSALTVNGLVNVQGGSFTPVALNGLQLAGEVTTSANQTYGSAVILAGDTSLTSTGSGQIAFNSTLDGAHALSLSTNGKSLFSNAVGATTQLSSLTTGAGETDLYGSVTTSGTQTYQGALVLDADLTLTSQGGALGFDSTVDGAHTLTVNAVSGAATFDGEVGSKMALTSLAVTAQTASFTNSANPTTTPDNDVGGLSVSLSGSGFVFHNAGALMLGVIDTSAGNGGVTVQTDAGALTLANNISVGSGVLTLASAGQLTQSGGVITAAALAGSSVGGANLARANAIDSLGAFANTGAGELVFNDGRAFSVMGAVSNTGGAVTLATITTGADITLGATGSVTSSATGDAVVLAADGDFINASTVATPVSAPNGVWLIYSQGPGGSAPGGDSRGGLTAESWYGDLYTFGSGAAGSFASAPNAGNRFVYGYQPTLTINPDTKSVTYNGADQNDSYTVAGLQNGDTASAAAQGAFTTTAKDVAAYTFNSGGFTSDENYAIGYGSGVLSITPLALKVLLIGTAEKTYDGDLDVSLNAANYSFANVYQGDDVTLNEVDSGSFATADVGSGRTVRVTGLTLSGGDAGDYSITGGAGGHIGVIDPKTLTASLTGVVDKTYDSGTRAALASGDYLLDGIVFGDAVDLNDPTVGTYDTQHAGTGKTVYVSGLKLTGAKARDYVLASTSISGAVGTIDPKMLTARLLGTVRKVYDGGYGATLASANYHLNSGVYAGDVVTLNGPTDGAYASKDVGTGIQVSVTGVTLGGDTTDYTVASALSGDIGTITPKKLTASLIGTVEKPYDGGTTASLTMGNYSLSGWITGDNVGLNDPTSGTYSNARVGTGILVTVDGLALTGADMDDYTVNTIARARIGVIDPQ